MASRSNARRKRAKRLRAENAWLEHVARTAGARARRLKRENSAYELIEASGSPALRDETTEVIRSVVDAEVLQPLNTAGRSRFQR